MTLEELRTQAGKLDSAIEREDETAAKDAAIAIGIGIIGALFEIRDALKVLASPPNSTTHKIWGDQS